MMDQRRRLFRRVPGIGSLGDAYDVGTITKPKGRKKKAFKQATIHLEQPLIRYRGLYPVNSIRKHENRMNLFHSPRSRHFTKKEVAFATSTLGRLRSGGQSTEAYWNEVRRYFDELMWEGNPVEWQPGPGIPRKMLGFREPGDGQMDHLPEAWEYDFRDSLAVLK
jgi:hypothetical protein